MSECRFADVRPTGISCPGCGDGTLEAARGRFGPVCHCRPDTGPRL